MRSGDLAAVRNDEPADRHGAHSMQSHNGFGGRRSLGTNGWMHRLGHAPCCDLRGGDSRHERVRGLAPVSYGIQDDAWLRYGPGTVDERVATLQGLGLDIVRVTVRWDAVERGAGHVRLGRHGCRPRAARTTPGSTPSSRSTARPSGRTAARARTSRRSAGPTSPRSPARRRPLSRSCTAGRSGTSRTSAAGCRRPRPRST